MIARHIIASGSTANLPVVEPDLARRTQLKKKHWTPISVASSFS
jgi:hypothetical protein